MNLRRLNPLSRSIGLICLGISVASTGYAEQAASQTSATSPVLEQDVIELPTIVATAQKKAVVAAGTLGARSARETPFSIQQIDSKQIEEQQAKSLGQLFANEAGVAAQGNSYAINSHALSVRGLSLDFVNGYKIDGHPFQMASVELPLELFQEVQLLKGATGFLYGIGSPGGTLNYITKKPTDDTQSALSIGYRSDSIVTVHADTGGRLGSDERYGYRFNVVNEKGQTFNGTDLERQAISAAFDAQITPNLVWRANGLYQQRDLKGGISSYSVAGAGAYAYQGDALPKAISGAKNLTAYDQSYYDSDLWALSTGLNWQINDLWRLDASYAHTFKRIESRDETLHLVNEQGDYHLALRQFYRPTLQYDSWQLRLEGEWQTGWLKHKIVTGLERQTQSRDLNIGDPNIDPDLNTGGQNHVYPAGGVLPSGNIYAGSLALHYDGDSPREYFRISDWETRSVYFSDTLSIHEQWSLLLGLRKFDYENKNYFVSGKLRNHYREKPLSPTAALLFYPNKNTTLYASYVEALDDGGYVGSTYANAYAQLSPLESKQYELGLKAEYQNWALTSALFRIEKGMGYANAENYYIADGQVTYDGFELAGHYQPTPSLRLNASATFLDAEYKEAEAQLIGNRPAAVARIQANLGAEQKIEAIPGLKLHGNVQYIGSQYIDAANRLKVPTFEVVNIGLSYRVPLGEQQLTYRAEINNLFDKKYWLASSNALSVAAPRTLSLNIKYDF
ncbi:TonB-dependent receptor [Acinetobacter larvae]|uniref:TonB-dependent receptor n=1 Tax=Acinetobacter larvae TaxID=1789224 RepID=A0A1B2M3M6_9GAMM|nr:TonB-dependent receptor [Acinetobacter larvae]